MTVNKLAIARAALYASAALNLGMMSGALWRGDYGAAGLQSVVIVGLTAWLAIVPKFDAWIDARLAEAIKERDTAQLVFDEVQRMQRAGELRLGVTAALPASARTH